MGLKEKKCEKCGSDELFKPKRDEEHMDDVRCMTCGLEAHIDLFIDKNIEKNSDKKDK